MEKKAEQRATPKTQRLAVDLPDAGFTTVLFFNRFGIERGDGYFLVHFGFVTKSGDVLGSYSTVMTDSLIEGNRQKLVGVPGQNWRTTGTAYRSHLATSDFTPPTYRSRKCTPISTKRTQCGKPFLLSIDGSRH